jgi:hypothetical protein
MLPSLAVFDRGRHSAPIPLPSPTPYYPVTPLASTRHHDKQAAAAVLFQATTHQLPKFITIPPVLNLRSEYQHATPPSTSQAPHQVMYPCFTPMAPTPLPNLLLLLCLDPQAKHRIKLCIPVLHQWLPPHCQTSCFFSVWTFLVFPGYSTVIPTPLLEKQMPYVYTCSCDTNKPPTPLSKSSTKTNHSLPRRFNGTLFGQVFYLPLVAQALPDQVVVTADPLPLPCDPFTSTPTTPLQLPEIIPFLTPDSIDLTIQPPNNLLHTSPILSEHSHASAIPDPTTTQQCQVATPTTLAQYSSLSPYPFCLPSSSQFPRFPMLSSFDFESISTTSSCLPSSSQFPRFLMIPHFDFKSLSTTTRLVAHRSIISKRPPPKPPHTKSAGFHHQSFTPHVYPLYQLFG